MATRERRAGLVSIIVPVYNRPRLLVDAIESALAQTYRPIEIVVVDGSTDETTAVARDYAGRFPGVVHYLREPEDGWTARARNIGLAFAAGEFVQFLDSDDLLMPTKLERQTAALAAAPECGLSYCYVREYPIEDAPSIVPARRTATTLDALFPEILRGRIWPTVSPLYRRSVIDAAGPFMDLQRFEDWEFETRIAALGVRLHHCREFLADMRRTSGANRPRRPDRWLQSHRDGATAIARIFDHALRADVAARHLAWFAPRAFDEALICAWKALPAEADECARMALSVAPAWSPGAFQMRACRAASRVVGWPAVGRWWRRYDVVFLRRSRGAAARAGGAARHVARAARRLTNLRG